MSKDKNLIAIILAILAAALYAISTPVSKVMLQTVAPTMVAAFLYLGAGIGMGAMMLVCSGRHRTTEERLLAVERLRYTSLNYDLCILEFNITYFQTRYKDEKVRDAALLNYPPVIQKGWKDDKAHKIEDPWILVPASAGGVVFCFSEDSTPLMISAMEELSKLKDAVGREEKRDENELYKLLIQRMPIDNDGHLVFELDEVAQIHAGVAGMLQDLDTVDVLTTFGETTLENLQDSSAATQANNRIEKYSDNAWDSL